MLNISGIDVITFKSKTYDDLTEFILYVDETTDTENPREWLIEASHMIPGGAFKAKSSFWAWKYIPDIWNTIEPNERDDEIYHVDTRFIGRFTAGREEVARYCEVWKDFR